MNIRTLYQFSKPYVILPVLFSVFIISIILRQRQIRPAGFSIVGKVILAGLLTGYLILYTYLTLSYRSPSTQPKLNLNLFWSYRAAFRIDNSTFRIRRPYLARQILLNILVMIPAGLLLPLAYRRQHHPYLLTLLTGFALSVLIEALQYFMRLGLCELDDILNNTLGCLIGILLFHLGSWGADWLCKRRTAKGSR